MIDERFQGRGIGAAALKQVVAHVRAMGVRSSLLVSYMPGPGSPEKLYLVAGFRHTGKLEGGEIVLELALESDGY